MDVAREQDPLNEAVKERLGAALALARTPDPEVLEKPQRRRFDKAYKLRILEEADRCSHGEIGALLRREGLYASNLRRWRKQRAQGKWDGKKRSGAESSEQVLERLALEKENRRLRQQLERAETVIELQKKLYTLLELDEESGKS